MLNNLFKTFAFLLFIPMLGFASNNPVTTNEITLTVDGNGTVVDMVASRNWSSGSMTTSYLDFAHTQKNFDNIQLEPGVYEWKATTRARNNKKGKMNVDITVKYQGSSNRILVNTKINATGSKKGNITIEDFKSKSGSSSLAGYGKVKVHVGRAGANTNVLYQVTLRRTGDLPCVGTNLGSKNGNVVGNTLSKYTSNKPACKNRATVKVQKTGGKAKTMVTVYKANTKNGSGTYVTSYEFPNGKAKSTKTFTVNNANGKYIRIEVKNRSAANTFKYSAKITQ